MSVYNKEVEFNQAFIAIGALQRRVGALRDEAAEMLEDLLLLQRRVANAMVASAEVQLDSKDY